MANPKVNPNNPIYELCGKPHVQPLNDKDILGDVPRYSHGCFWKW